MARSIWKSLNRKRIEFEDDIVITYDEEDNELYRGLEDYEPSRDVNWKWDEASKSYEYVHDGKKYRKICLDLG